MKINKDDLVNRLNITAEQATNVLKLMALDYEHGDIYAVLDQYPNTAAWYQNCFKKPGWYEVEINCINEEIEGFGVVQCGPYLNMRKGHRFDYINLGDTYTTTICYDKEEGEYILSCWGDLEEEFPSGEDAG